MFTFKRNHARGVLSEDPLWTKRCIISLCLPRILQIKNPTDQLKGFLSFVVSYNSRCCPYAHVKKEP